MQAHGGGEGEAVEAELEAELAGDLGRDEGATGGGGFGVPGVVDLV